MRVLACGRRLEIGEEFPSGRGVKQVFSGAFTTNLPVGQSPANKELTRELDCFELDCRVDERPERTVDPIKPLYPHLSSRPGQKRFCPRRAGKTTTGVMFAADAETVGGLWEPVSVDRGREVGTHAFKVVRAPTAGPSAAR